MTARRGWDRAAAAPDGEGGHLVLLDWRELRLPDGSRLRIAAAPLAAAIAAEWNAAGGGARGGGYSFADLTLTRLAATETTQVAADPAGTIATLLRAADTDMLCYRAATPAPLVRRQHAVWQPWLDWVESATGAAFRVTEGVMPQAQPDAVAAALRPALVRLDPGELTALLAAVPALGSLVLGLALLAGRIGPAEAARVAHLEAEWEAELWGEPETWRRSCERLGSMLAAVRDFLELRAAAA